MDLVVYQLTAAMQKATNTSKKKNDKSNLKRTAKNLKKLLLDIQNKLVLSKFSNH